jgi:hypothetical protein
MYYLIMSKKYYLITFFYFKKIHQKLKIKNLFQQLPIHQVLIDNDMIHYLSPLAGLKPSTSSFTRVTSRTSRSSKNNRYP